MIVCWAQLSFFFFSIFAPGRPQLYLLTGYHGREWWREISRVGNSPGCHYSSLFCDHYSSSSHLIFRHLPKDSQASKGERFESDWSPTRCVWQSFLLSTWSDELELSDIIFFPHGLSHDIIMCSYALLINVQQSARAVQQVVNISHISMHIG